MTVHDWNRTRLLSAIFMIFMTVAAGAVTALAEERAGNDQDIIKTARLPEPLIATGATTPDEDAALADALTDYGRRKKNDDVAALEGFVLSHPESAWSTAVLTNEGILYAHYGYFTKAIKSWEEAWHRGRMAQDPRARALVDRALGELAMLDAGLGRFKSLSALFGEIGDRPIVGSATEDIQVARELLDQVKKDPRHLYLCGPRALRSLMIATGENVGKIDFLNGYRAGPEGTSLAEVRRLAAQAKYPVRLLMRKKGQSVPVPSVVHWKLGHFAAIIGKANGRYHVVDQSFPNSDLWISPDALDAESSGYFLAPASIRVAEGWRDVGEADAERIRGKGPTSSTQPGAAGPLDVPADKPAKNDCMCGYNIMESTVSLNLTDTPVGYTPAVGPSVAVTIAYNQREDSQPQNLAFSNVSPKWSFSWGSYIADDPANPGAAVSRSIGGGGAYYYSGYSPGTGRFSAQTNDGSVLVLASQSPITYRRQMQDGSVEIYAQSDGSGSYPRRIFLSRIVDPQGNAVTLNYDNRGRLSSLTDARGRQTLFDYGLSGNSMLITRITDPFGRYATLAYDAAGRLSSITDVIGLTSSFSYDANSLVNSMTTPYGTTSFAYTAPGTSGAPRFVQVTDPMGFSEREEWIEPAPVPASDPVATLPQGMPVTLINNYLQYRDSFHWDKDAYVAAGCAPTGGCDYSKARDRHFNHVPPTTNMKSTSIESEKEPLEDRVWYAYPQQASSVDAGTYEQPTAIGRVLGDGTTQLWKFAYDEGGYYKPTRVTDPAGRVTNFSYANQIDLVAISQNVKHGDQATIAQFVYNAKHRPILATDAAGQVTAYAYNAVGQLTSTTNPLNQTTSFSYDGDGNLLSITNANNAAAMSFTYDAYGRIATSTDSEGWTLVYSYDAANRITKITYPDGTSESCSYDRLDIASYTNRKGYVWKFSHDANRRLVSSTDPLGNVSQFGYSDAGRLTSRTDPKGNVTRWSYDVEGRLLSKQYADASVTAYAYEPAAGRLASTTDALNQVRQYSYTVDDRISGISYVGAVNQTPNVAYAYDPYFPFVSSMTDGTGVTSYTYVQPGANGALDLASEAGPLASSSISYGYDELGRVTSRVVGGQGVETFQYDSIGRVASRTNDLGTFALSYLGQTGQITQRRLVSPTSTLATNWSYLDNVGDRRLAAITNTGPSSGQHTDFQFTSAAGDFISSIAKTGDASSAYPPVGQQSAVYNNLNQLTALPGRSLTYDADGNLLDDGIHTYKWDAERRLVGISYLAEPGKQTTFVYDGLGRRTGITSTPAGGASTTKSYVWCGSQICQSRDTTNQTEREYFPEGEYAVSPSAQAYYYGIDQIGSVRRAFTSGGGATSYDYDPYGNALQSSNLLTDFGYAGMFYNADSNLYLTRFRIYDPTIGRWLSRDPSGETSNLSGNLYTYVDDNPISNFDPLGLWTVNIGLSVTVNAPAIGRYVGSAATAFGGIAYDGTNLAWYYGGGGGVGAGTGLSAGVQIGGSNAKSVCDLVGLFKSLSASTSVGGKKVFGGAVGGAVGGEGYWGHDSAGRNVIGGNFFGGVGAGTRFSGMYGTTKTWIGTMN